MTRQFTKQDETKKVAETLESQNCLFKCVHSTFFLFFPLFKGKSDESEEKGEEAVTKPVRSMPKKARNPFLSEKYV